MKLYTKAGESLQYMVATHTNTLMVYNDTVLKWAAQLNYTPVHLDICHMGWVMDFPSHIINLCCLLMIESVSLLLFWKLYCVANITWHFNDTAGMKTSF